MKRLRTMKRNLELEYGLEDATQLAIELCEAQIYELSEEHKKIISYLQEISCDFSFDNFYLGKILICDSLQNVMDKFHKYTFYIGENECDLRSLSVTMEKVEEWKQYFLEEEFAEEQVRQILRVLIKMGPLVKSIELMHEATNLLDMFEVSKEQRKLFICKNADLLYNDYSRKIEEKFTLLINNSTFPAEIAQ